MGDPTTPDPGDPTTGDDGTPLDGARASDAAKIAGIVAQTRADYPGDDPVILADRLRQRFEQSEIPVSDDDLAEIVHEQTDAT